MDEKKLPDLDAKDQYHHYCHKDPMRKGAIILIMLLLLGGAFVVGRWSNFGPKRGFSTIQVERNVSMSGRTGRGFGGMMGSQNQQNFRLSGQVTKIDDTTITVKGTTSDYTVLTSDNTSYLKARAIAKRSDLKIGDTVVAAGPSNSQGQIVATAINIQ